MAMAMPVNLNGKCHHAIFSSIAYLLSNLMLDSPSVITLFYKLNKGLLLLTLWLSLILASALQICFTPTMLITRLARQGACEKLETFDDISIEMLIDEAGETKRQYAYIKYWIIALPSSEL